MRENRKSASKAPAGQGPYGRAFHFAGQYPLPVWMQHLWVIGALVVGVVALPVVIVIAIKNGAQGDAPLRPRGGAISRQIAAQREAEDPAARAKKQFLEEQSSRPVLDVSAYESMATTELVNAINHAGPENRTQVVRTLALSRSAALRLLPWCNEQLRLATGSEHAAFIWTAAVKFSGCDPADVPRERLNWRAALRLDGSMPLSGEQHAIWACVLDASAAEEAAFRRAAVDSTGPR